MNKSRIFIAANLLLIIGLTACQKNEVTPEAASLNGTWELTRVFYGFSNVTQTASQLGYTERYEFVASTGRVKYYKDNQLQEDTRFTLSTANGQNIVTFTESNEYSNYRVFEEGNKMMLSLYQRTATGTILADGGVYYYEKK